LKFSWIGLLILVAVSAHSQTAPDPADSSHSYSSIAEFGLVYPLSNDWVRATQLLRGKVESSNSSQDFDILLAAVYVPKSSMSETSPFFSLVAYRQPATDCKKNLEAMIAHDKDKKEQPESGVEQFSAAGRDYFRVNLARGTGGRHRCIICTLAKGHLLVWEAGAPNDKGLDAVVATLNSIAPLPQQSATIPVQLAEPKDGKTEDTAAKPVLAQPEKVRLASGVMVGLLIKKVSPVYPSDARAAYIQGMVILKGQISKAGDVTDLELINGPIELAGSAVAAVRQWKYKPYLLMGQPVAVETLIQVNYQLHR
jgi:TonB family protein